MGTTGIPSELLIDLAKADTPMPEFGDEADEDFDAARFRQASQAVIALLAVLVCFSTKADVRGPMVQWRY
jgi:hypothetical protein